MQTLTVTPPASLAYAPAPDILALALEGISGQTLRAYQADWRRFAAWHSARATYLESPEGALRALVGNGQGNAQRVLYSYRRALVASGASPNTINRLLCALRYVIRSTRRAGVIDWTVDVQGVRATVLRDTRGPGAQAMERMLLATTDPQALLVLRLLHDMALRRMEVANLMLADYAPVPEPPRLWITGKGKGEREGFTMPSSVIRALEAWLQMRGNAPGSLTGVSYARIPRLVQHAAIRAGVLSAHPHGLRHAAITKALELTHGDVRRVQKFARHAKVETTLRYDDARTDEYGSIGEMVGGE